MNELERDKLEIEREKQARADRRKRARKQEYQAYRAACAMNGLVQVNLLLPEDHADKFKEAAKKAREVYRKQLESQGHEQYNMERARALLIEE